MFYIYPAYYFVRCENYKAGVLTGVQALAAILIWLDGKKSIKLCSILHYLVHKAAFFTLERVQTLEDGISEDTGLPSSYLLLLSK